MISIRFERSRIQSNDMDAWMRNCIWFHIHMLCIFISDSHTLVHFTLDFDLYIHSYIYSFSYTNRSHASYEDLEKLLPKDIFQYCREHRLLDAVLHHPSYHAYPYYQPHPAHPHVHPAHGHVHPAHGHGHAHPQGHGLPGHPPTIASLPPSHAYAHAHPDSSASGTGAMSEANRAAEAKAGYDARTATAAATSEYPPSHPRAYPTR